MESVDDFINRLQESMICDYHTHLIQWSLDHFPPSWRASGSQLEDEQSLRELVCSMESGQPSQFSSTKDEGYSATGWKVLTNIAGKDSDDGIEAKLGRGDWSWLDNTSVGEAIFIRRWCGHRGWLSPRGADLFRGMFPNSAMEYGRFGGGILVEGSVWAVDKMLLPSEGQILESMKHGVKVATELGIGMIHDIIKLGDELLHQRLVDEFNSELKVGLLHWAEEVDDVASIEILPKFNVDGTNTNVWTEGVKVFLDGSLGARTAALRQPYQDQASNQGILLMDESKLTSILDVSEERGLPVAMHAIGDFAMEVAIGAIEKRERVYSPLGKLLKHRIEHAQLIPPDLQHRLLMVKERVILVPSPSFLAENIPGGLGEQALGSDRVEWLNPVKWMLNEGFDVRYGSDMLPFSPMEQLQVVLSNGVFNDSPKLLNRWFGLK